MQSQNAISLPTPVATLLLFACLLQLIGPEGSPYADGLFQVELKFTRNFPGEQPNMTFRTQIWHPNIGPRNGVVCVAMGTLPGDYQYQYLNYPGRLRVNSAACVLVGLQMLLSTPNPQSPVNQKAAHEMSFDKDAFTKKAMLWTKTHATSGKDSFSPTES